MRQSSKLQISAVCFPEADCPIGWSVFVGQGLLTIPFPFSPFILLFLISSTLIGCFFSHQSNPNWTGTRPRATSSTSIMNKLTRKWNRNKISLSFTVQRYCFFLTEKNWFFLLKLLARNDPLHLVGVRHLVLEKNHHHGLWPRLLGSRNSEYQNYFHSLLSEGAPEKIAAASDFPWADAWRFLGWLHKWQVGCGELF